MTIKSLAAGFAAALFAGASASAALIPVTADITVDTTWTEDNTYVLTNDIYVLPPAKLTIQPGTLIRAETRGTDTAPGVLVISRGAKIEAIGTPEKPIILTNIDDSNVPSPAGTVPATQNGVAVVPRIYDPAGATGANGFAYDQEWGGLILLGRSRLGRNNPNGTTLNEATFQGVQQIEGLAAAPEGRYGGDNDADDSGIVRFCSIRYGGFIIGANNEVNGLTMGALGSETVVEWQEVFNNSDDGFEFFGGNNNTKFLFSLFNGDDTFDYDQGFRGKHQFWFSIQDNTGTRTNPPTLTGKQTNGRGDRIGELDGAEAPNTSLPQTQPIIFNVTGLGRGIAGNTTGNVGLGFFDNSGGKWNNVLIQDLRDDVATFGLFVNDAASAANIGGILDVKNAEFWNIKTAGVVLAANLFSPNAAGLNTADRANRSNISGASYFTSIDRYNNLALDPRLVASSHARTPSYTLPALRITAPDDGFYAPVSHLGAMRDNLMLNGWSVLRPQSLNVLTAAVNAATPTPTYSISGANTAVNWTAVAGVSYLVEASTDGKYYDTLVGESVDAVVSPAGGPQSFTVAGTSPVFVRITPL